ncbi:hypothetical protein [Chelativorans sp. ZYF759]|nr:hypothetical protein [Chelativorans sp. ZYF759]
MNDSPWRIMAAALAGVGLVALAMMLATGEARPAPILACMELCP